MAYQIPQQLEYKEKIMFGLNFKQLAYAFVFGTIALICFKSIPNGYVGGFVALIPSLLGLGFMFFNLEALVLNYRSFLQLRKIFAGDPRFRKFLGINKIEDHVITTDKNKKIAVLKVQPINFSIKPSQEKEAIMGAFQKFLNSLDFPIQILMNTESLELNQYLNSLKSRIKDKKFMDLFEKYKKHLENVITNNKIMNRVFYVVIPETNNLEIQINVCIERLQNLNLKVERLNTHQIKDLMVKFFSGSGEGDLISSISPEYLLNFPRHIETNGRYCRIISASGYPRSVEGGFLDRIVSSLGDFDLSIHITPHPIETMMINLNKELQKQRADLYAMQNKAIINPTLEIQYKDTKNILEELQKGKEKLFDVSLYINCKADSLEELELLSRKVESELNSLMIIPSVPHFRMLQGFKSIIPLGNDNLKISRNVTTRALSAFFPFTSQFSQVDDTGVWLGLNKNKIPIIRDIFKLPNANGVVLAQSGGGKSYFCKLLISRYLLNGTKVMVIDPQGEYAELVKHFDGQRINISRKSKSIINPLDLMGHEYAEKRLSLIDLMSVMLGKLTEPQKAIIDKALTKAYTKKGITEDPSSWKYDPPILGDVLKVLNQFERKATAIEKTTIRSLINRLSMYVDGVFSFLNNHTNINFNNKFVCFDIGNMPKQVKPVVMFLVLDYVYNKMKSDLSRKILLIDEAWSLLSRTEDATHIFEIVKTCRKFNLGLLLINQEVEGLLSSQAGKSVLANSSYTLLMRQKPAVIDSICKTFNLSSTERTHLLTASIGEGVLIMEDDHSEIRVIASDEEHNIITTKADELIDKEKSKEKVKIVKEKKEKEEELVEGVGINVDEFKGFFRYKELNKNELRFLLSKKYIEMNKKSIVSGKVEKFLLKPRFNESVNHLFMIFDIAEFLEKKGIEVQKFITKKPDLVFEYKGKKYAIEVETGIAYEKARKQLMENIKELNEEYDEWYFVPTNKNYISKYRKLGNTIDFRYLKGQLEKIVKKSKNSSKKKKVAKRISRRKKARKKAK